MVTKGEVERKINLLVGINICTLYEQVNNNDLLCSIGNYIQDLVIMYNEKESEKYIYIFFFQFTFHYIFG